MNKYCLEKNILNETFLKAERELLNSNRLKFKNPMIGEMKKYQQYQVFMQFLMKKMNLCILEKVGI